MKQAVVVNALGRMQRLACMGIAAEMRTTPSVEIEIILNPILSTFVTIVEVRVSQLILESPLR